MNNGEILLENGFFAFVVGGTQGINL